MSDSESALFATLRPGARIWAVGAIHGERDSLARLHRLISGAFQAGDQIVYLGGYSGQGRAVKATIDELLLFRRSLLSRPGVDVADIVFLRGAQEEMWQKLLQLQFAPDPVQILRWMVGQGIGPTIEDYGMSVDDALLAARDGILALTRWTGQLRQNMHAHDGHTTLMNSLRHAALRPRGDLLFVHAGVDPQRPLSAQNDSFWWGGSAFDSMDQPFEGYQKVVRGYDRRHSGVRQTAYTLTLDGGAGFGGELVGACFASVGSEFELISA